MYLSQIPDIFSEQIGNSGLSLHLHFKILSSPDLLAYLIVDQGNDSLLYIVCLLQIIRYCITCRDRIKCTCKCE
jgi:hypothetical protein